MLEQEGKQQQQRRPPTTTTTTTTNTIEGHSDLGASERCAGIQPKIGTVPSRDPQTGVTELNKPAPDQSAGLRNDASAGSQCNGNNAISCSGQNGPSLAPSSTAASANGSDRRSGGIDDRGIKLGAARNKKRLREEAAGKEEKEEEMRSSKRIESPLQFVGGSSSSCSLSKSPIESLVAPPTDAPKPATLAAPIAQRTSSNHLLREGGSGDRLLAGKRTDSRSSGDSHCHCSIAPKLTSTIDCGGAILEGAPTEFREEKIQPKELEVEWVKERASLFKRSDCFSGNSRLPQQSFRTSLVKSIKSRSSLPNRDSIGRAIKYFVDHFRSNIHGESSHNREGSKSKDLGQEESSDSSDEISTTSVNQKLTAKFKADRLVEPVDTGAIKREKQIIKCSISQHNRMADPRGINANFRTSISTQSIQNRSTVGSGLQQFGQKPTRANSRSDSVVESATKKAIKRREGSNNNSGDFIQVIEEASSNNNKNNSGNMTTAGEGSSLAKNKYIIDDKLKTQQQGGSLIGTQARQLEDRRSTYCSSVGAATTTDMNFDSSFSSANNCSESNITCTAMNRQCSREFHDKSGNSSYECRLHPSHHHHKHQRDSKPNKQQAVPIGSGSSSSSLSEKKTTSLCSTVCVKRDIWGNKLEFLLAVIGFAVDLGNVWRFPYICYKNGGGAFLIPYTILFLLGGLPIFYLEMSLGQYFSSGCLTVWGRVCPMAKGIGYAMVMLNLYTGLYYNTIISWAVFFFFESFKAKLPWTSCDNSWNSKDCRTIDQRQSLRSNYTSYITLPDETGVSSNESQLNNYSSPTKDYFEREVLHYHLSKGIDDLGQIRMPLAFYLAVVFICIYFAIWKGVKSTGKVVWITALLPYFVLIPLLVRGVFLEGAWLGIKYYLYPQWIKLLDVDVWVEAAKQIYFSLGPGFGTLMALSSYNKFNHNCRRDTLIAAAVNYFASFISGFVIFAVLGYMATIQNVSISEVATEGPGLVFQVYPEGLAMMAFSSMWSVFFFAMVITLGIDSTFGGLESIITGLCDEYPRILRAHRGIFIAVLIIIIYLCSLPTTTNGGQYVITILESYGTSLSLLFIVLIETIIVCWLYGADKFCMNLEEMYGETPGLYWRYCWKYISPTILLLIFFAACLQELDKYHTLTIGHYTYPDWAPTIGLLMTGSSICCIPLYAIYYLKTQVTGSFIQRLKIASRPIEGEQRGEKEIYVDAVTDKIRDENEIHLDTVI